MTDGSKAIVDGLSRQTRETNQTFVGSCGRTWRSIWAKPASCNIFCAVSHPHMVPSPVPPWPIEIGVQWAQEMA